MIAALAARQDLIVEHGQLMNAGVTEGAIKHRLRVRRLHRVYPRVYAVHSNVTGRGRYRAAVLACGRGAVLSHRSAADLLGLRFTSSSRVEVTVPRGNRRRPDGIDVHESRRLPAEEITIEDGIPCTSWARTIVDNAGTSSRREVDRMLERSTILRIFDLNEMRAALANANGKAGVGTVHELLAQLADEAPPTRLELERRFLELITEYGLPMPVVNGRVEGYEVDFHWPHAKVIVETDGRETHATPYGFERDRQRDLDLDLAEWHVIRITWKQLTGQPHRVARLLRGRLSREAQDSRVA